ncbi:MAG: hypothetical protein CMJ19_19180 [Phycisphaeraceae bacterium]|nr:hypothetical protein [Phycisphaeraceae bacterium]|tara:strand:- start:158 stop:760 length:603 start_codon:yes stop_codon:yes gene_type:complete
MKFAAIDFETANTRDESICAAAVATFENDQLMESLYWLVRPPKGYGFFRPDFISVHGLTHLDVCNSPEFSMIASDFYSRLEAVDMVVAHNAQFDIGKLRGTSKHFGIQCPSFKYLCTCQLARRVWPTLKNHRLSTVADHVGHDFDHHHARSDAEAAGWALLAMMKHRHVISPMELAQMTNVKVISIVQENQSATQPTKYE